MPDSTQNIVSDTAQNAQRAEGTFQEIGEKVTNWWHSFSDSLPNILIALGVIWITFILSRIIRKASAKLYSRKYKDPPIVHVLSTFTSTVFVILGLIVALEVLDLDKALTSVLAGAGLLGLAIGLAFQEPFINIIAGVTMSVRNFYNVGDLIQTGDYFGKIRYIGLRFTTINLLSGELVFIPNKLIVENPMKNYTISGVRRVELHCGISYGEDLKKVKEVTLNAIKENVIRMEDRPLELFFTEFGDSSINYVVRYWVNETEQAKFLNSESDAIMAIKAAYDANDITIPFPIRTLDFGIKGGEKLSEVLPNK